MQPTTKMQFQLFLLAIMTLALTLALPTLLPSLFQNKETQRVGAAQDVKGDPATPYFATNPEEIATLVQKALAKGTPPTAEGEIFLEKTSWGVRQYVTITLSKGMLGEYSGVERVDFIQETWRKSLFWHDKIDQWVVSTKFSGQVRSHWHKHIEEKKSFVLKEEWLPVSPRDAQKIVRKMASEFLNP
jgi:hypothetical protein